MLQKKNLSKKKKKLDFEAVLWDTSALKVDLVERISRSSTVSQNFQKNIISKQFICFQNQKKKNKKNKKKQKNKKKNPQELEFLEK